MGEIIYNNCLHPIPDDLSSNSSSCSSGNKQDGELYVLHKNIFASATDSDSETEE